MSVKNATTALALGAWHGRCHTAFNKLEENMTLVEQANLGVWCVADPEVPRSICAMLTHWASMFQPVLRAQQIQNRKPLGLPDCARLWTFGWLSYLNMFSFLRWFSCHVCSQQGGTRLGSVDNDFLNHWFEPFEPCPKIGTATHNLDSYPLQFPTTENCNLATWNHEFRTAKPSPHMNFLCFIIPIMGEGKPHREYNIQRCIMISPLKVLPYLEGLLLCIMLYPIWIIFIHTHLISY